MDTHLLTVKGLHKTYGSGPSHVHALNGIDLTMAAGELLVLTGPSGCGKSTLLNILGCIERPDAGQVSFQQRGVPYQDMKDLDEFRRDTVGLVFQDFNLIPILSAYENVELPLLYNPGISVMERKQRVMTALRDVGLEQRQNHTPSQLSGGQSQRVAIARALVNRPQVILADEPTANLDTNTAESILDLMHRMTEHFGTGFLIASHDDRVLHHANRILCMRDGQLTKSEQGIVQ